VGGARANKINYWLRRSAAPPKNILEGTISVLDTAYTLKATNNKRRAIYDDDFIFDDTAPYFYYDIVKD
jgi:hypothetical protein